MSKLAGKVALVTGGGRGIGPVIAQRLADDGAEVIVSYAGSQAGAEEVAAVVAFLCSEEASWVSGTNIMVNGAANA